MITLEQKNKYMRHQAVVLRAIYDKYKPSEENLKVSTSDPWFGESCKYSDMAHEIFMLVETLNNMVRFNEIIIESEKNNGNGK